MTTTHRVLTFAALVAAVLIGYSLLAPSMSSASLFGSAADDGVVDGTVGVFADVPAVTRLDPDLRTALRAATEAARSQGVAIELNSGWRSAAYQQRLVDEAIDQHGSAEQAAKWAASPKRSAHVRGDAVDVSSTVAARWLAVHGAAFGLCQVYGNEPWHVELRPDARVDGCPTPFADASQDPRLQ